MARITRLVASAASAIVISGCGSSSDSSAMHSAPPVGSKGAIDYFISAARASVDVTTIKAPDAATLEAMAMQAKSLGDGPGGVLTVSSASKEKSIQLNTWNYFTPAFCLGNRTYGTFFLTMFMTDGTWILTTDPAAIAGLGAACIASPVVGVFPTGVSGTSLTWQVYLVGHI